MGTNIKAQSDPESDYVKAVIHAGEVFLYRNLQVAGWKDFIFYQTEFGKKQIKSLAILHGFTKKVIQERKMGLIKVLENKDNNGSNQASDQVIGRKKRLAFLDLLLEQHISEGSLTEEDIREEVDTFMFEGHDTTAMAISWGLHFIGLNQDVQKKLHEELDEIFGDDKERAITTDDLSKLKYLDCCVKETLRLCPSVPLFGREFMNDTQIGKYIVPKGTMAGIFAYQLHRNKDLFPNPEVFDPERWMSDRLLKGNPYGYVPFSAGPRNCIGQKFALQEDKIVMAHVLRNFNLKSLEFRDKIDLSFGLILRPKTPVRIEFTKRT